jgi:hypothetical protein
LKSLRGKRRELESRKGTLERQTAGARRVLVDAWVRLVPKHLNAQQTTTQRWWATGRTRPRRTRPRPTPRRGAAGAAEAAAAGPAAAQNHAGREPVRLSFTPPRKYGRSPQSAPPSRSERPCRTFGTSFYATRGTTGRGSPRSCAICSWHAMSRSGSARMILASASRFSALSTRAWRSRGSGSCS